MTRNRKISQWAFSLASLFIISLILWNTYSFFNQLKENERVKMEIWAKAYEELLHNDNLNYVVNEMVLSVIQSNTTTPMILHTLQEDSYTIRNIDPKDFDTEKKRAKLVAQFSSQFTPIEVKSEDELLEIIYYGNAPIINKLKYYPALLILILILFISAIYLFYRSSKSAEQNKLWAGMAKETAHQIGTPLSSLVGWTEILKSENVNQEYVMEMGKDIKRLETITDRFSKIGSKPKLERCDLVSETISAFNYLQTRTSKLIDFELSVPDDPIYIQLNPQLYSWTIENLVKNGIDAMKGKGKISIAILQTPKQVLVHISDSGKGLTKSEFKQIFVPGYTTKKRGWGLGLSLAKRIIEEYHQGKIRVVESIPHQKTTLEIAFKL